jgi:proline dehydrogenase
MSLARTVLLQAAESRWIADQLSRRGFARRAVQRFMPGEQATDALEAARTLAAQGQGSLVTQLGEALSSLSEATAVRDHYLDVFRRIEAMGLPTWVSIKPTQLGIDQSMDTCRDHVLTLGGAAEQTGSSLWVDMEDHGYVDRTLEIYRALRARHDRAGIAIQSYLYRTPKDIEALLPLSPWIRLVKGAYREPTDVAYPVKRDVDLAYYDGAIQLLTAAAKGQAFPIFGTHDIPLLRRIMAKARSLGIKPGGYEIHMLYGIKVEEQAQLAREGEVVKTLISYGSAWFKWYMRRLAERPANIWFALRSLLG